MGSLFQTPLTSFTEQRARRGFEPGTSRTQSENHTPRPTTHPGTLFNAFLQQVFTVLKHQYPSAELDGEPLPDPVNKFHRTKGSSGISTWDLSHPKRESYPYTTEPCRNF